MQHLNKFEGAIAQEIQKCRDSWDGSFNLARALRHFQSLSPHAFAVLLKSHSSNPDFDPSWIPAILDQTVEALITAIPHELRVPGVYVSELDRASRAAIRHSLESTRKARAFTTAQTPKELKTAYLAAFPEKIKILDICWAAAQRYSEWKRWLRGALKEGSLPDRSFRAILSSGKKPIEYRSAPRPHGWK